MRSVFAAYNKAQASLRYAAVNAWGRDARGKAGDQRTHLEFGGTDKSEGSLLVVDVRQAMWTKVEGIDVPRLPSDCMGRKGGPSKGGPSYRIYKLLSQVNLEAKLSKSVSPGKRRYYTLLGCWVARPIRTSSRIIERDWIATECGVLELLVG